MTSERTYGAEEPPYEGDFENEWLALYNRSKDYLTNLGFKLGFMTDTEFWLVDEHYDLCLLQVETRNLDLFHPRIVDGLRSILNNYPAFAMRIMLAGKADRPGMGIIIYKDKIVDALLHQHLPVPYKDFIYS